MRSPLQSGKWLTLESTPSTQESARELIRAGGEDKVGVVFAHEQTQGVGRFGRDWYSEKGHSMTASLIFWDYADHPKPWLIGMNVALAVAGAMHCRVSWPNDVQLAGRKVGGILTHVGDDPSGRKIPIVGIGLNLHVSTFPGEISERAGNLDKGALTAEEACQRILDRIPLLPEPDAWDLMKSVWANFDETAGKHFRLPTGEEAVGIGIGPQGELICAVEGETRTVLAADALFGGQ